MRTQSLPISLHWIQKQKQVKNENLANIANNWHYSLVNNRCLNKLLTIFQSIFIYFKWLIHVHFLNVLVKRIFQRDICILMFIPILITIAKILKQVKCQSTNEWIKYIWYICIHNGMLLSQERGHGWTLSTLY